MSHFWHRPTIPAAKLGMHWHVYKNGATLCRRFSLLGLGIPKDARARMPSRATSKVCEECERKRPAQIHFSKQPRYVGEGS